MSKLFGQSRRHGAGPGTRRATLPTPLFRTGGPSLAPSALPFEPTQCRESNGTSLAKVCWSQEHSGRKILMWIRRESTKAQHPGIRQDYRDRRATSGSADRGLERVMGIEPTLSAWEAEVLPLNYTRLVWILLGDHPPLQPRRDDVLRRCGEVIRQRLEYPVRPSLKPGPSSQESLGYTVKFDSVKMCPTRETDPLLQRTSSGGIRGKHIRYLRETL